MVGIDFLEPKMSEEYCFINTDENLTIRYANSKNVLSCLHLGFAFLTSVNRERKDNDTPLNKQGFSFYILHTMTWTVHMDELTEEVK